jgi:hypothetical protein
MKRIIPTVTAFVITVAVALMFAPVVQPSVSTIASAQTATVQTVVIDQSPECGSMVGGQWVPSGQCGELAACGTWTNGLWSPNDACPSVKFLRLSGVITIVKGTMVTIQQADRTITVDDKPALKNEMTGRVAVGRAVTMHGYWKDNMFFATRIDSVL